MTHRNSQKAQNALSQVPSTYPIVLPKMRREDKGVVLLLRQWVQSLLNIFFGQSFEKVIFEDGELFKLSGRN